MLVGRLLAFGRLLDKLLNPVFAGLPLVRGEGQGGLRAEAGVQGAGHRPHGRAAQAQDVPQVSWSLETGHLTLETFKRTLDTENWNNDIGLWTLNIGHNTIIETN